MERTHTPLLTTSLSKRQAAERLFRETYPLVSDLGLVKTVGVFTAHGGKPARFTRVEDFSLSGIAALVPKPFVVRIMVEDCTDKERLAALLRHTEERIRHRFPEHRMLPSHPGWVKRTVKGKILVYVLFGEVAVDGTPNHANSRLTRLIGHIDEQSRYLGKRTVRVLRGDHEWKTWDGWCLVNPNRFHTPTQTMKLYGVETFGTDYIRNGGPTVKCCAEVSHRLWKQACKHLGIFRDAADVIVPEVSLKFDDGRDAFTVELFNVFESVLGTHCTVSLQLLMNVPLTEEAHVWAADRMIERIREINEAVADPTGTRAAALMDSHAAEVRQLLADGEDCEDQVEEGTEAMNALITRIVAGLPVENSKYAKGVMQVLVKRLRNFRIAGGSEMVVPDNGLRPGEVAISRRMWHHMRKTYGITLEPGDRVVVARYPITGTEVAECTVKYIGRPAVNPQWWAERFSGDHDGDRYAIGSLEQEGISTLVDEAAFTYPPQSEKVKTKVPMDIATANAAGFWSQSMIPTIDTYLRICNEKGLDAGPMKNLLQWTIDSAKNQIEFDIGEVCRDVGISGRDRMSALATLMSGRLGSSKHHLLAAYNGLVRRAKQERTRIRWMQIVRERGALSYVIPETGDPAYASMVLAVTAGTANGYEKFLAGEMQRVYEEVKAEYLVPARANMEQQAVFPMKSLDPKRVQAVRRKAYELPQEARELAREVLDSYNRFVRVISGGVSSTTQAFGFVKDAVERVRSSEYGADALKYLFAAVCLGVDPAVKMRATTVLGYLPLVLGSYNIARIISFLEYERIFAVRVLADGETLRGNGE